MTFVPSAEMADSPDTKDGFVLICIRFGLTAVMVMTYS